MQTMTSRERWMTALEGGTPDRIPTDIWAVPEVLAKLRAHLGCEDFAGVREALNIDALCIVAPVYAGPERPSGVNEWGVATRRIGHGSGEYTEAASAPLARAETVAEIERYAWPDPEVYDYSSIPAQIDGNDGRQMVRGGHYEPFLIYCQLRGMEQAYIDVLAEPDMAEAALSRIFEFHYEYNRRILEAGAGRIDVFSLAEDLGGQTGPLFSLDVYRRFLMPNQRKMAELAHRHGARVFYHTDGAARPFLPDLIDTVGIDILNPLQWRCPGMELEPLVRDYGKSIAFHGGIDNQQTLPFGSVDDVRNEVRAVADIMRNARWICAPCHNIQDVTPPENVVAMYETIAQLHD